MTEWIVREGKRGDGIYPNRSYEKVQEVVRCRDCKHRYISGNGTTQYYVCDYMDAQYEDNGYCNHGERKGGEEE